MTIAENGDILVLGLTIAAIGMLGFVVFFNDPRSATNRAFLLFTFMATIWGIINFAAYQVTSPGQSLWLWRLVIFTAVCFCLSIFQLALIFPEDRAKLPHWYTRILAPLVSLSALLTLTPLVFTRLVGIPLPGVVPEIENGPLIPLFGLTVAALICATIYLFIRKARTGDKVERSRILLIMIGTAVTFILLITFNFVLPTQLKIFTFIPYGAIFILPFIACTAYAIARYHLFNARVIAAEMFSFFLTIATLIQIVFSRDPIEVVFHISAFFLVLAFSILLVKSVLLEVKQREEIEKLSNEKSEFMTFASHEIRNPITAMRGYASLIADGTAGEVSAQVRDISQKILVEGNEVLALISQFLSKSKMELGQISYSKAPFDIGNAVSAIADGYKPHAEQKGLALVKHVPEEKLLVSADEGKLKEVLGNLIDNSLKYTKEGSITVSAERHGVAIRVTIADTGVGIAPETLPQLFKKFSRADAQRVNLLGTGVGLYLAKTFIENMGGRIWAESEGTNRGSRFIIEFPAAEPLASVTNT